MAELHQPSSSPVPCLIHFLGVTLRCKAFHLLNVQCHKLAWGRSLYWCIGVTPSSSERPASYTAGHVDQEKRNTWVISVRFFFCFSNFCRYGASLSGLSGRWSSAKITHRDKGSVLSVFRDLRTIKMARLYFSGAHHPTFECLMLYCLRSVAQAACTFTRDWMM